MNGLQRAAVLGIALGMLTTVSLPNRVFHKVVTAGGDALDKILGRLMGTRTG